MAVESNDFSQLVNSMSEIFLQKIHYNSEFHIEFIVLKSQMYSHLIYELRSQKSLRYEIHRPQKSTKEMILICTIYSLARFLFAYTTFSI